DLVNPREDKKNCAAAFEKRFGIAPLGAQPPVSTLNALFSWFFGPIVLSYFGAFHRTSWLDAISGRRFRGIVENNCNFFPFMGSLGKVPAMGICTAFLLVQPKGKS